MGKAETSVNLMRGDPADIKKAIFDDPRWDEARRQGMTSLRFFVDPFNPKHGQIATTWELPDDLNALVNPSAELSTRASRHLSFNVDRDDVAFKSEGDVVFLRDTKNL